MRAPLLAVAVLGWAITSCDVVSTSYPTKLAATREGLVAGGALPQTIPESSYDVRTENDLDGNTSTGSFRFDPAEGASFANGLEVGGPPIPPVKKWADSVKSLQVKGYELRFDSEQKTEWAFLCKFSEGACNYFAWPQ